MHIVQAAPAAYEQRLFFSHCWLCEVFPSVRFTAQASLMQTGKPTCGNMRLTNYSIHAAQHRTAPRSNCSPNQPASQAVSEQASLEACLHSRC